MADTLEKGGEDASPPDEPYTRSDDSHPDCCARLCGSCCSMEAFCSTVLPLLLALAAAYLLLLLLAPPPDEFLPPHAPPAPPPPRW